MAKSAAASVEPTGDDDTAAATAAAPDAGATTEQLPSGSDTIAEAEHAVAFELAEVREEISNLEQAVMSWCNEHFSNSPISRATEALNYLREHAVPDLIKRIERI